MAAHLNGIQDHWKLIRPHSHFLEWALKKKLWGDGFYWFLTLLLLEPPLFGQHAGPPWRFRRPAQALCSPNGPVRSRPAIVVHWFHKQLRKRDTQDPGGCISIWIHTLSIIIIGFTHYYWFLLSLLLVWSWLCRCSTYLCISVYLDHLMGGTHLKGQKVDLIREILGGDLTWFSVRKCGI